MSTTPTLATNHLEEGDEVANISCRPKWKNFSRGVITPARLALLLSFLAMITGLVLIVLSQNKSNGRKEMKTIGHPTGINIQSLTPEHGKLYWRKLRDIVLSAEHQNGIASDTNISDSKDFPPFPLPKSPEWKALQWMVLDDPLAPKFATSLALFEEENRTAEMKEDGSSLSWKSLDTNSKLRKRLIQRFALAVVYYSASGDHVLNTLAPEDGWMHHVSLRNLQTISNEESPIVPPFHECHWRGIECDDFPHEEKAEEEDDDDWAKVTQLDLSSSSTFSLNGLVFPDAITLLTDLQILNLSNQGLRGTLPKSFFTRLSNLRNLDLKQNQFTSAFSSSDGGNMPIQSEGRMTVTHRISSVNLNIGMMTNLEVLSLSDNLLTETLPSEISLLTSLRVADFKRNMNLKGRFWDHAVPYWSQIEVIEISDTSITGTIPDIDGNGSLQHLKTLAAQNTAVTGTLPHSLASATNLEILWFFNPTSSSMSGTFPTEYGRLTNVKQVVFSDLKGMEGTLPREFGNWQSVEVLNLIRAGRLTGTLPTEWGKMTNLRSLQLSFNDIEGTIPSELANCVKLELLELRNMKIRGTMPPDICSLRENKGGRLESLISDCASNTLVGLAKSQVECNLPTCCTACM